MRESDKEYDERIALGFPVDICEWCGQEHPWKANERYYGIEVQRGRQFIPHKVCGDCYDRLQQVHHKPMPDGWSEVD
jgi:hypothetical protein